MRTHAQQIDRSSQLLDQLGRALRKAKADLKRATKDGSALRFIDQHRAKILERSICCAIEELGQVTELLADSHVRRFRATQDLMFEAMPVSELRDEATRQRRKHEAAMESRSRPDQEELQTRARRRMLAHRSKRGRQDA